MKKNKNTGFFMNCMDFVVVRTISYAWALLYDLKIIQKAGKQTFSKSCLGFITPFAILLFMYLILHITLQFGKF
jgi:hypothetical protein